MANGYASLGGIGTGLGTLDPMGRDFLEQNPDSAYADYLQELGLTGTDNRSQFARGRFGSYYDLYKANLARDTLNRTKDPNLYWTNFMRNFNPSQDFQMQGATQRGEYGKGSPRLKWLTPSV